MRTVNHTEAKFGQSHTSPVHRASPALEALRVQQWFKLICGASYQHLPAIRNLALVYTLAGADCIDMAADPAVIRAARAGVAAANNLMDDAEISAISKGMRTATNAINTTSPLIMISLNAGEDPHFRKAEFADHDCPSSCDRPCQSICPTQAIQFTADFTGIINDLCYGCGRCLPVCPPQIMHTREQIYLPESIPVDLIDAIEIHTQPEHIAEFRQLWQRLAPIIPKLQLMAVSFPDCDNLQDYLMTLLDWMQPRPRQLIWQTDGRPMSGDIGNGATRAAVLLGQKVLGFHLPFGFVQIAGGTNASTVGKLRAANITVAGVAYGSYARKLVADWIDQGGDRLEEHPQMLWQAVAKAKGLVAQIKSAQGNDRTGEQAGRNLK